MLLYLIVLRVWTTNHLVGLSLVLLKPVLGVALMNSIELMWKCCLS